MELFICRHGIAEDHNPGGDAARRLTEEGSEKVLKTAEALKGRISPDIIISSPYLRAKKTAELIIQGIEFKGEYWQSGELYPFSDIDDTLIEVNASDAEAILLVGHNPHLSTLCSALIGAPGDRIILKKSAVAKISFDSLALRGAGVLKWLVTAGTVKSILKSG
ncbi:MAG: phosphohistidine phosphatase SixA [Spirochaetia bacterium]